MKIRPMNDRIIVKRDPPTEKTSGGLIIPDTAKQPLTRGTVIATGPGAYLPTGGRREPTVKVGDKVIFGKYSGSEFEQDGEQRIAMIEDDLLGIIDEE